MDRPLHSAAGPAAGGDAAPCAVRGVVDDVPRAEVPPVVGADAGCGEQGHPVGQGSEAWSGPQDPRPEGGRPPLTLGVVGAFHAALGADAANRGERVSLGRRVSQRRGGGRSSPTGVPWEAWGRTLSGSPSQSVTSEPRCCSSGTSALGRGRQAQPHPQPRPAHPLPFTFRAPSCSRVAPVATQETRATEPPAHALLAPRRGPSPGVAVLVRGHHRAWPVRLALDLAGRRWGRGRAGGHALHVVLVEDGSLWWALRVAAYARTGET